MKKLSILALIFLSISINAQTKKVFLEEFSSAHCLFCIDGANYVDSMLNKYPNLISVACHAGYSNDFMWFSKLDSLVDAYQIYGVPSAAIDRIHHSYDTLLGTSERVGQYRNLWDTLIQQRLNIPANLTVEFGSVLWDSVTRDLSAEINVDIITELPVDDYRIGLYIVEDSVIGYQMNIDCNPINDYCHRRVARDLLPSAWSPQGILPELMNAGQSFTTEFEYNLPDSLNANQISLIAFVYRYSENHQNDEVLNVEETPLFYYPTDIVDKFPEKYEVSIYPNPTQSKITVDCLGLEQIEIVNITGKTVKQYTSEKDEMTIDLSDLNNGFYLVNIYSEKGISSQKIILEK